MHFGKRVGARSVLVSVALACAVALVAGPAEARKKKEKPRSKPAAAAKEPAAPEQARRPAPASARDWVVKYLDAIGNDAYRGVTSRSIAGTVERLPAAPGSVSRTWKLELFWKAPAKAREVWLDTEGKTRRVFDGEKGGWIVGPGIKRRRLRQLERVELVRLAALFQPALMLPLDEAVLDRRDTVGGREAVVLKLKSGEAIWLDAATALPLRLDLLADRPESEKAGDFYLSQVYFEAWKLVGATQVPHLVRRVLVDQTITWRFTEVLQGLELPDRLFKKPYFWRR